LPDGLLALALADPLIAGGMGALLGLLAAWSGQRVARWSHVLGLRSSEPGGCGAVLGWAAATGLLSAAFASGGGDWWRPLGLGVVWGQAVMDLANNARAAAALRAVAVDGPTLGAWLQLPIGARLGLTGSVGPAVTVVLAFAALLTLNPGLLGFLLGAIWQVQLQKWLAQRALAVATADPETDS